MTMETTQTLARAYIDCWNETDPRARRAAIGGIFAEKCSYIDPNVDVKGRDGIDGFIGAVQKQFAGVRFVLADGVDAHHAVGRFTWHAMAPGRPEPVAIGFDVIVTDEGRITQVVGFLDKVPG
jgi:hypothetical protein